MKVKQMLAVATSTSMLLTGMAFAAEDDTFALESVDVVSQNSIEVFFNHELTQEEDMFEFEISRVVDQDEDFEDVLIDSIEFSSPTSLVIHTLDDLRVDSTYDLIVLLAVDSEYNSIESGVGSIASFNTPEMFEVVVEEDERMGAADEMDAEVQTEEVEAEAEVEVEESLEVVDELPEVVEDAVDEEVEEMNAGGPVEDELSEAVVTSVEVLPATGAQEIMLLVLAMLLSLGVYFVKSETSEEF